MATNDTSIVRLCEVKSIIDDTDGLRIKVRLTPEDNDITLDKDLPYAFPLIPKMLHVTPKIGECVFIILANQGDKSGNRYYIGPVISQPQMLNKDPFNFSAVSLLEGNQVISPAEAPSMNPQINGTLPEYGDIAIQGRQNCDIIMKDNEMRIRCGFKESPTAAQPNNLFFNKLNPAYIQMKYIQGKLKSSKEEFGSAINVVADKINLLSHISRDNFNLTDAKSLISDEELLKILDSAHPVVYGDTLVQFLKLFLNAFMAHSHAFPMDPPTNNTILTNASTFNFNEMLSTSIKVN